jgi:hypothetical protein
VRRPCGWGRRGRTTRWCPRRPDGVMIGE